VQQSPSSSHSCETSQQPIWWIPCGHIAAITAALAGEVVSLAGCTGVGAAYPYEAQLKRVDTEAIVKAGSPDFVGVKFTVTLTEEIGVDILLNAGTGSPTVAKVCNAFDAAATAMPFTPDTVQARGDRRRWGHGRG
jgi:hypothetical protein